MIDPVERAREITGGLMPAVIGHYDGAAHMYAVITEVDEPEDYGDNAPIATRTLVQVDIWRREVRPQGEAQILRALLEDQGYTRVRRGGDSERINNATWHRISCDYEYYQEVD